LGASKSAPTGGRRQGNCLRGLVGADNGADGLSHAATPTRGGSAMFGSSQYRSCRSKEAFGFAKSKDFRTLLSDTFEIRPHVVAKYLISRYPNLRLMLKSLTPIIRRKASSILAFRSVTFETVGHY
jgi:hypothetical protein